MKYIKLNNGIYIPVLGTGTNTFGKKNHDFHGEITFDTTDLTSAFSLGYRLIDTAIYYRNEAVIGKAIKETNIPRAEFFITTKIPEKDEYSSTDSLVHFYVDQSLKAINADYIDLYLMHFPRNTNEENLRVWKVLEKYVDKGLIRSIGVSNFNESQLSYLMQYARIKPVINQFLSYPGKHNHSLIEFCKKHQVIPEAYQSIKRITDKTKNLLNQIAKSYQKTLSQIILNYQVNQGLIVIPKSHNHNHQNENINIFDFTLTKEDTERIYAIED